MAYQGGDLPTKRAERGSRLTVIGGGLQSRTGFGIAIATEFGTAIGRATPNTTESEGRRSLDLRIKYEEPSH
jgi:hypothetical protein